MCVCCRYLGKVCHNVVRILITYRLPEKEVMERASKFDIPSPIAQYVGGARGVYT